jgi:isoleucyl-tRNA synthetase
VCSAGLALRAAENARVRQPLQELVVAGGDNEKIRPYLDLIADEVNVKQVTLSEEIDAYATFGLRVDAKALGPRLGKETKAVLAASKQGQWSSLEEGRVEVAGHVLEAGEFSLTLSPREGIACRALPGNEAIVVLDLELSPELVAEGRARDVVRVVQQARKEAGLHVADRIRLVLPLPEDWREAVEAFRSYVSEQTLASELLLPRPGEEGSPLSGLHLHPAKLGGQEVTIGLERSEQRGDSE